VAINQLPVVHFLPPNPEQATALQTTCTYLHQAGTQVASVLLGFPALSGDTTTLAEFSTQMLCRAALCDGLLDLADHLDREVGPGDGQPRPVGPAGRRRDPPAGGPVCAARGGLGSAERGGERAVDLGAAAP
jgi:hypothetical protein